MHSKFEEIKTFPTWLLIDMPDSQFDEQQSIHHNRITPFRHNGTHEIHPRITNSPTTLTRNIRRLLITSRDMFLLLLISSISFNGAGTTLEASSDSLEGSKTRTFIFVPTSFSILVFNISPWEM